MTPVVLGFACGVFLIAGMVKGIVGLGLPSIAVGGLSLVMTPAEAVAILVVPSLITNVWQLAAGSSIRALWRRLWSLLVFGAIGIVGGCWFGLLAAADQASIGLGVALLVYAAAGLGNLRLPAPPRHEYWLSPLVGLLTGIAAAATGVFVMPAVPYLQSMDFSRDDLVQALGLWFTVATVALAVGLGIQHSYSSDIALAWSATLVAALVGMAAGQWIRLRISPRLFRVAFFLGLLMLGLHLVLRRAM